GKYQRYAVRALAQHEPPSNPTPSARRKPPKPELIRRNPTFWHYPKAQWILERSLARPPHARCMKKRACVPKSSPSSQTSSISTSVRGAIGPEYSKWLAFTCSDT